MRALQRFLMLTALASTVLFSFASDTSATPVTVEAKISFARVIRADKQADVTFGELQPHSNDQVSLGMDGSIRLLGTGEILSASGEPSLITLGDSRGQVLNLFAGNYGTGGSITSLKARCVINGQLQPDCDNLPLVGKEQNKLFIGMDMIVSDPLAPVENQTLPSFDMSVVYQ